jgi:hypothetical protein
VLAHRIDQRLDHRVGLHPVHRTLYIGVEILDTHAHPVEPETLEQGNGFRVHAARIDLYRVLAIR